ncbi:MAG: GCN5-related N-acetyltransferase, partial [Acidimicrobiaceae bacterium]|nr:GCN5-related N-acetyltransferase [Acidimicrobiaceae bacterium]
MRGDSGDFAWPEGARVRAPTPLDHGRVLAVMDIWWGDLGGRDGSRQRALLLPRLFFQHFAACSYLVEGDDARLLGFLIGFVSASQPDMAYIHFVGVDPEFRRAGLGAALYAQFFNEVARQGARTVNCITSPGNEASVAFHRALGFDLQPGDSFRDGLPVHLDYDGPGLDRVAFT